ncbi:ribokinase [Gryllotalpicola koreensis]|uniref:Ribokinase n=1 Tax=Gryllotalpicola koreensis TaxID=993086 RepID=A0ABP8A052_9MICO
MSATELPTNVVVVGSANVDITCSVDRLPIGGETVMAAARRVGAGGKGANQAVAAARSGASTGLVCALGKDSEAELLRSELGAAGVRIHARRSAAPTGTAYITVDAHGENSIVVAPGANAELIGLQAEESNAVSGARVVLMQLETPLDTVRDVIATARAADAVIVLNAAPFRALPAAVLNDIDILIVNEHEAGELAASVADGEDAGTPRLATVTTLGGRGAVINGAGFRELLEADQVEVVDTTGAGDTFCGAFAAALAELRHVPRVSELVAAARFAMTAATLAVQRSGAIAAIPSRAEVDAVLVGRGAGRSLAGERR